MNRPTTPDRLHALDAVRAGALLLGIVLHATMSFFFVVPARDVSQSTTLAVTFFVIHTFRMTLFFVIAGFFGRLLLQRRGVRGFLFVAEQRQRQRGLPHTHGMMRGATFTSPAPQRDTPTLKLRNSHAGAPTGPAECGVRRR